MRISRSNIKNCFLVFCASLVVARSCHGSKHVALFIFGDSLYDAGNNKYIEDAPIFSDFWPYGETFFKHPTGRPCDGRLIPDFIAQYANLPLIPPYLQPGDHQFMDGENFESKGDLVLAENLQGMVISSEIQQHLQSSNHRFINGVNFASSGAGALVETHHGWVINLSTQLSYFKHMKRQLRLQLGEAEAKKLLSTAVYMFSIGGNDYFAALTPTHSLLQLYSREEYVGMVIGNITTVIQPWSTLKLVKLPFSKSLLADAQLIGANLEKQSLQDRNLLREPKPVPSICFGFERVVGINRISDLGETLSTDNSQTNGLPRGSVVEFSMNGLSDGKGMKLVEKAERKMVGTNSCWQNAYQNLFAGCSQILAVEEKRWRFAWHLSDCFQKDSGRPAFPYCDTKSAMVNCLKRLNDNEHKVYLEFSLETNSICYQLQAHAFNHKMERLVNDLKNSAEYTEEQLEIIGGKTHVLLQRSNQIQDSLSSIDIQVENVAQTTKDAKDHMDVLSKHSEAVYKHSKEIAQSQSELQEGQAKMNENLKEGMSMLHDAYTNLGQEVDNVRNEAVEIEKQIGRVGDTMSSKTKLLSTLQHFAEYGHKQQEELLQQQEQLQKVHGHLVVNSNSILAAQEAFESKQASMFIALEKLFALHNAMLLESRIIKAFILYTASIFIVYMFTSTKQTYTIRARLYVGLVATFLVEVATLRLTTNSIERQTWLINVFRLLYGILASIQFLHAIFTYRDYEVLNHHLILNVMDKINVMQKTRELSWETDSDVDWSSWIQTELAEGGDNLEDPDFMVPEEVL
ncbi:hypothetical protein D5086_031136 [Populus alba]|uniref:Uncharacterized protein n=1 Tax=Populus alba TaxID=43335 RepID=A0ACC4AQM1_POPAL